MVFVLMASVCVDRFHSQVCRLLQRFRLRTRQVDKHENIKLDRLGKKVVHVRERNARADIGKKLEMSREAVPRVFPVKVDTMAGYMYYLCDSWMVKDFGGMLEMGHRERDKLVCEMDRRYYLGDIVGVAGGRRVGVDYYGPY